MRYGFLDTIDAPIFPTFLVPLRHEPRCSNAGPHAQLLHSALGVGTPLATFMPFHDLSLPIQGCMPAQPLCWCGYSGCTAHRKIILLRLLLEPGTVHVLRLHLALNA
eukprot:CAMPEP_0174367960 /NCGR_PEP_ID=MMETSP0811_2-20130205/87285_1 /TAXON_ID=73025 ORGANISM="Eutreptiella gymnastica-like, Strain CCMP1594" /NCGR_SAMPLE_ID=MMETSP0811_2 /ASSEMBLY_ACC=CAM_ASM_000667 /LENGTH=106 /DNA_ID=CAMNT_0015511029 /DNA_START=191 /DNA_END=508 /DNA_ORIENTATION=-